MNDLSLAPEETRRKPTAGGDAMNFKPTGSKVNWPFLVLARPLVHILH